MAGRKRSLVLPQRIDVENDAKRFSFCQFIPRVRSVALATIGGQEKTTENSHHQQPPQVVEKENSEPPLNTGVKRRKRKGKKRATLYKPPTQQKSSHQVITLPTIAEDTLASIPTVPIPDQPHDYSIPILHIHSPSQEALKIKLSRFGSEEVNCICIGKICISLSGGLPLNKLFLDCKTALRLTLEMSKTTPPLLKIADHTQYVVMGVKEVTPPISLEISRWLSTKKHVRLSAALISEDTPLVSELIVEVWATEALCTVTSPSEMTRTFSSVQEVKKLLKTLLPDYREDIEPQPSNDTLQLSVSEGIKQFYKDVQVTQKSTSSPSITVETNSVPGLSAMLREYQCRAVEWMLWKEGVGGSQGSEECEACDASGRCKAFESGEAGEAVHKLWRRLPISDQDIFFNPFTGKFSKQLFPASPWPKGGILADEMGLGKTVEILALILAHPYPDNEQVKHKEEVEVRLSSHGSRDFSPQLLTTNSNEGKSLDHSHLEATPTNVVQCLCGATSEEDYEGEFVQCETCLIWFHSTCVDYLVPKHGEHFHCVKCLLENPLPCGTTLIISPQAIAQQWMEEISKHSEPGAIDVFMYNGISRGSRVSPLELARHDIVIVTYETLCTEFYHAMSHEMSKTLRKRKRYFYSPSPLPALLWWRVCLDEAQMVESTNVRAAEMTKKLSAVNRWCVTGTPVQKQLLDLYGLLLFLNVDPYDHSHWFSRLVWQPYLRGNSRPIVELFAQVMWRNSKADVASELGLPEHSEQVHWLHFSSVEEYYYKRQREKCSVDLEKVLRGLSSGSTLSSLVQATFNKLMTPLHSLRQACCHPQLVRSVSYLPVSLTNNKSYITMPRLLEKLIQQAKVEAREALRQLVAALNGLAAIFIMHDEVESAVRCYREAMTVWQDHLSHDIDCDKLQRIHTMENLAELLELNLVCLGRTLRDDSLIEEAAALRSKYTEKVEGQVKAAAEALFVAKGNIDFAQREFNWLQAAYLEEIPPELMKEVTLIRVDHTTTPSERTQTENLPSTEQIAPTSCDQATSEGVLIETSNKVPQAMKLSDSDHTKADDVHTATESLENIDQTITGRELDTTPDESAAGVSMKNNSEITDDNCTETAKAASQLESDIAMTAVQSDSRDTTDHSEHSSMTDQSEGSKQFTARGDIKKQKQAMEPKNLKPLIKPLGPCWVSVCEWLSAHDLTEEVMAAVRMEVDHLTRVFNVPGDLHLRFSDLAGVSYYLSDCTEKMQTGRQTVLSLLDSLCATPTSEIVHHASSCHLRPAVGQEECTELCPLCVTTVKTHPYERLLFSDYKRDNWAEPPAQDYGGGSRKPGVSESITRTIFTFAKQKGAPKKLQESGHAFLSYLDQLKKEYTAIRSLWLALDQRLRAHDELNMASTRLRLMDLDEALSEEEIPYAVHPWQVMDKMHEFESEKATAELDLKKCLGQVLYLKNLAKQQTSGEGNQEPCPVCTQRLDREWAVFPCGHPLCIECTSLLIRQQPSHIHQSAVKVKCPLCREAALSKDINYVKDSVEENQELQDIPVQGCHSTKVAAVVRTLLYIQQTEPGAKCLVFSTWLEVLDIIASALRANSIGHQFLKVKKTFQENLSHFKTSPDTNVLLLPFHSGSKGLNIVEASHVLLVEPLLNQGVELQAIGRVHRMGQTRATKVHRFLVSKTVEEKIFTLLNAQPEMAKQISRNAKESQLTLSDVRALVED